MRSPFPGMDPYMEAHWLDVHPALCTYARDALNTQLGGDLLAHMGERVIVETLFDMPRNVYPDVRVIEHGGLADMPVMQSDVAVAEPLVLDAESEPLHQPFVEIIEAGTGKVITVIEFLSPTNKLAGDGQQQYRKKQREVHNAGVTLVEIDLVRTGDYVLLAPEAHLPSDARTAYKASILRGYRPQKLEYYPMPLSQRLSAIRIPLRATDPDVVLNIQSLVDQAYANGRYAALIDYTKPCVPPLTGEDVRWAEGLLKGRG